MDKDNKEKNKEGEGTGEENVAIIVEFDSIKETAPSLGPSLC